MPPARFSSISPPVLLNVTLVTVAGMVYQANKLGDTLSGILANEPIYYGLIASLVTFVVASLATPKTDDAVRAEWDARVAERKAQAAKAEQAVKDSQKAVDELRKEGMRPAAIQQK